MGQLPDCCIDCGLPDNCDNKDCNFYGDRAYFFNQWAALEKSVDNYSDTYETAFDKSHHDANNPPPLSISDILKKQALLLRAVNGVRYSYSKTARQKDGGQSARREATALIDKACTLCQYQSATSCRLSQKSLLSHMSDYNKSTRFKQKLRQLEQARGNDMPCGEMLKK